MPDILPEPDAADRRPHSACYRIPYGVLQISGQSPAIGFVWL